ncbi:alpha-1,3/1,6-mannosyltransferase ALG2-like [Rhizophagus clarus]|uniref:Alpha-1,3/1,6-mannosyltransferase ALG2 n=1 Tax=Rhizophagus clarus TaxID=94130 RepID=A0A8H3QRR6_9GLOM|nr:alpha-1,3/1,6-mannosyltransferase ALG2-like [Rhizophagus clarus]
MSSQVLKVAFVHPDLGIGGAERLVVDAAIGLQTKGHKVVIYTSHHDPTHCFEETRNDTLEVRIRGNYIIPRTFFGSFYIICAILRQIHLTFSMIFWDRAKYDVIFVDQLSASVPLLRLTGFILLYPVDFIEELTTDMANCIVVNSKFTAKIFRESFPHIKHTPRVLYPGIHFDSYDKKMDLKDKSVKILETTKKIILSINRFERKKNIILAIHAFAKLRDDNLVSANQFNNLRLVIAGGYDYRVQENVDHHVELNQEALKLELKTFTLMPGSAELVPENSQIIFLCSFNESQRTYLLSKALCLLYTPSNEHFGIVPVEAMYARLPVIAINNGGPKETVKDRITGLLCSSTPIAFSEAIASFINGEYDHDDMGDQGRKHVQNLFSLEAFVNTLEEILLQLMKDSSSFSFLNPFSLWFSLAIALILYYVYRYPYMY